MTPRERLKQDLDTVRMPPEARAKIAAAMCGGAARRLPARALGIAAAMLLFFGAGAGMLWMTRYFSDRDTPAGPTTKPPEPTEHPTPEPTLPAEAERMLALVTAGQYTDTAELREREGGADLIVTLGDGTVLTASYDAGEFYTLAEWPPIWYHADFNGDGTEEIVVCLFQRYDGHPRILAEVHVLEVEDGELIETLTVMDRAIEYSVETYEKSYFFLPKTDDVFGMDEYPYETALWISGTCVGASLDEFDGRPALKINHVPRQAMPYTLLARNGTEWIIVRQEHEPRPEIPRSDTPRQTDTGAIWWRVEPTPLYGESELQFCDWHGFFNREGILLDPRFGAMGPELGHGGGTAYLWLYDPSREELVCFMTGEGETEIVTAEEFALRHPEERDRIAGVAGADFDKIYVDENGYIRVEEAISGKCAVLYGGEIITDFVYDYTEEPSFTQRAGSSASLAAMVQNGKWGVVDKTGLVVVPFELEHILPIDDETVFGRDGGLYGVICTGYQGVAYQAARALLRADLPALSAVMLDAAEAEQAIGERTGIFEDVESMVLLLGADGIGETEIQLSYRFRLTGGDSFTYVSMELVKTDEGWKVRWMGMEG